MSLDPDREAWDENRWAWDSEVDTDALRSARRRLVTVLHRQASGDGDRESAPTQDHPTKDAGPVWRRWWRVLTAGS